MMRSLYTAATGMAGMQFQIDVTSNNIANVNTVGYKKQRAEFADLFYQTIEYAGTATSETTLSPTGIEVGVGVKTIAVAKMFTQGNPKETGGNLDVMLQGNGFFQILLPDGNTAYTRSGSFKLNENGVVVNDSGYELIPQITIPEGTTSIRISRDGIVTVVEGTAQKTTQLGQLEVADFINPAGLHGLGDNLYLETNASGTPVVGTPGLNGLGVMHQGFVEMSNVQLVEEMTDLITGQRAYEANSKTIQTADGMLRTINQLKR